MKWNPADIANLPAKLKQQRIRCFILHGNDASRRQALAADLVTQLKTLHRGLEHDRLEASSILKGQVFLGDLLGSQSLFGGESLYDVAGAGESFREVLAAVELTDTPHFLLIRVDESLTKSSKFGQWAEASPHVAVIGCYTPEAGDMAAMVRREAEALGLVLERDALAYLATQMAGDAMAVKMEMEKLFLYRGGAGRLSLADVEAAVPSYEHDSADRLLAGFLQRHAGMVAHQLQLLETEQASPVMVHRLMAGSLIRVLTVKQALASGLPMEQAAMRAKPPFFYKQQDMLKTPLPRWKEAELEATLHKLLQIEADVKMQPAQAFNLLLMALTEAVPA